MKLASIICFCSGWIRTLVPMATYVFHRLIMGKVEMNIYFSVPMGIFNLELFYTEMFIEQYSAFHMNFVQIADFDWLPW